MPYQDPAFGERPSYNADKERADKEREDLARQQDDIMADAYAMSAQPTEMPGELAYDVPLTTQGGDEQR